MGDNKPTTRTLPSGEKVTHYPDGKQVLKPTNSLAEALDEVHEDSVAESAAQLDQRLAIVEEKRAAQQAGNPVPSDKSPL